MRGRAERLGFTGLLVCNANAYVSTDPKGLIGVADPCGPENLAYLEAAASVAGMIACAWGNLAGEQGEVVERVLRRQKQTLYCLGVNDNGTPRHPRGVSLKVPFVIFK